jgi:hypothetical protein
MVQSNTEKAKAVEEKKKAAPATATAAAPANGETATPLTSTADDPAMKAAARAYALSGSSSSSSSNHNKASGSSSSSSSNKTPQTKQQQQNFPQRKGAAGRPTTNVRAIATATRQVAQPRPDVAAATKPRLVWPQPSVGTVRLPPHNRAAATAAPATQHHQNNVPAPPLRTSGTGTGTGIDTGTNNIIPGHNGGSSNSDEPLPLVLPDAAAAAAAGLVRGIMGAVDESDGGDLDDYARFVKSLGLDDDHWDDWKLPGVDDDDEEEEFLLEAMEDDDDDDDDDDDGDGEESGGDDLDDDDQAAPKFPETQTTKDISKEASSAMELDLLEWDPTFYQELEEELGGLEEEDMEAAVATLLDHTKKRNDDEEILPAPDTDEGMSKTDTEGKKTPKSASSSVDQQGAPPNTPLRDAARASRTVVTTAQFEQLHSLMNQHYQLLTQQAVLSVRAAHFQKTHKTREQIDYVTGGETGDDLVEILDGAVGMLQDLDQNRKDSIRNSIQFETAQAPARRSLLSEMDASEELNQSTTGTTGQRRLTRAQFIKTLQTHTNGQQRTVFDIQGLSKLKETFAMVDKSVEGVRKGHHNDNILEMSSVSFVQIVAVCRVLFQCLSCDAVQHSHFPYLFLL